MGLLTIGTFARATGLSAKALRLYDELDLLRPAAVDPVSGYRRYSPDQVERGRLIGWLRRTGMPLARIQRVLTGSDPAAEVLAYWHEAEADFAARGRLVAFLVEQLSGKDTAMTGMIHAARADRGLVREANQDAAYAGPHLLAVADGFGAGGQEASVAAIDALKPLDSTSAGDPLDALGEAFRAAGAAVRGLSDAGTTLTALLWSGSRLGVVHVGDSRAYVLRAGELFQLTQDHVQGTAVPATLVRALHREPVEPDLLPREAQDGDRYLLCSDGLHTAVPADVLTAELRSAATPGDAVTALVDLANRRGGRDNVACVVADLA
ncbi:MerR family transcriptional regulator [Amycolatopsis endophytica]|uniref:Protein phosphatase n=1 Tax=Amycolatopsis endophytica TaxID=860233 RepID=A0A853B166_9PSEU|nr:MerR family transcriptional regulator [Amycolatopsis endophytica]NYI88436.1 protein phosphatase [Amycolatopsis endophytica]